MSHVAADFLPVFGDCIRMMRRAFTDYAPFSDREVLFTKDGQILLIAGSGTLGWDQVASNLVEPGENALVLNSGYFGDSFADCLETYGAKVTQIKANIGAAPTLAEVEKALTEKKYKVITITHVDTSTGVLSDAKSITEIVKKVSPDTLVILDAVCAVGSEEIRFDDWGLDVVITASQKGLGCPPGLSIACASQRALTVLENRKIPVNSFYASWKRQVNIGSGYTLLWIPIMQAYEKGSPMYFATPPVNLIYALHASLTRLTKSGTISLEERFRLHREASQKVKKTLEDLGVKQVPLDPNFSGEENVSNGMTAAYYPAGKGASDIIPKLAKDDITIAGGLHRDIKDKYFRIGHMGVSVEPGRDDLTKLLAGLKNALL
ncbi:hypothetical protein FRB96_007508 [Tulasnella sp. 330]|nr:hypothetical protein FRB96_007508 [Tulasnella sp. 330]